MTKEVEKSREDAISEAYASIHLRQSYQSWYEYEPFSFRGTREEFYLDNAIKRARAAKKHAEEIHEKQKPEYQKLILECNNHLAYHLAARGDTAEAKEVNEALNLARELKEKRQGFKYPPPWDDTISFVFIRFGNPVEKEEGKKLLRELISRERELGADFVYAVKAKYKNIEELLNN